MPLSLDHDSGAAEMEDIFSIEDFLAAEQAKELVRFSTAGSVDDGKSTLIGRLLYDSQSVYEDHVRAVTKAASANVAAAIDFAQLTDGLRAEREQGITIDVAYRYFSTTHRKFIIADTPGHEQYTRNMATGASTADVAIILVDARKGILTQSRRHAYIASLLGTRHIVAAVNKMDLVEYSRAVFEALERDLQQLAGKLGISGLFSIPISALHGDNVVERGIRMPWYEGPTLLEYLETVPTGHDAASAPFRLPIQRVIRPDQHYRGFAGQIASGSVWPGDRVVALPSGKTSRVKSITTFDGDLARAVAPMSIALTLEDELDISRGLSRRVGLDECRAARSKQDLPAETYFADGQGHGQDDPASCQHADARARAGRDARTQQHRCSGSGDHPSAISGYVHCPTHDRQLHPDRR
jgi:sulfate adenylyltransferase subunit 1